jgi:hypothetical protein
LEGAAPKPARKAATRRVPKHPLLTLANSPDKALALEALARWKAAHPEAASHLAEDDILIDRMRGSASIWYRIRVNLRNVPEADRPPQSTPTRTTTQPAHGKKLLRSPRDLRQG